LALWVFRDCLAPGLFPHGRDTVSHDILFFTSGWETVRDTGVIPLWNHQLFAGWPWVAAAGWTPWYPAHWLALVAPIAFAFTMQYVLHHAWAGLGFTIWGRALGLSFGPAILGGVLFQMSGHVTTLVYPGHLSKFEAIAWLPWVMAFSHMALKTGSRRSTISAAACLAMQILTQHAQIVYYTAGLLLALALWHWLRGSRVEGREASNSTLSPRSLRPLRSLVSIGLIAAGLAMVQLLPATEMIRVSNRAEGVSFAEATDTSYPPEELVELVWPGLFGSSVDGTYRGRWGERLVSDYLGLVTVIGALLAIGFAAARREGPRVWVLLGLLVFTLLLALGKYTPLCRLFYDWLPGWDRWRSPATIMILSTFAACTLAAIGWAHSASALLPARHRLSKGIVLALLVAGALDQLRTVRRHIGPSQRPLPESIAAMRRAVPIPESPLHVGRLTLIDHELSNMPLYTWTGSINGYHPIVLGRYENLLKARGYNDLQLHRLLGVRLWLGRPGADIGENFVEIGVQPGRSSTPAAWVAHTAPNAGEHYWTPARVEGVPDASSALARLAALDESRNVFEFAPIEGMEGMVIQETSARFSELFQRNDVGHERFINRVRYLDVHRFLREAQWVIFSQFVAPGWKVWAHHAERGRRPVPLHAAWGGLWALRLDAEESVTAEYRPASVRFGLFVTLASLATALTLRLSVRKTRRRAPL
jgi:hypothetical protein